MPVGSPKFRLPNLRHVCTTTAAPQLQAALRDCHIEISAVDGFTVSYVLNCSIGDLPEIVRNVDAVPYYIANYSGFQSSESISVPPANTTTRTAPLERIRVFSFWVVEIPSIVKSYAVTTTLKHPALLLQ